jgi:hypothetical protein
MRGLIKPNPVLKITIGVVSATFTPSFVKFAKRQQMNALPALINELENKLPFLVQKNDAVSQATVGWHIEHSLLAFIKMISAVEHSNPADYKSKFNWKRSLVLAVGKFPRGKARAPESVRPATDTNIANITGLFEKAKQKAELFEKLDPAKYFTHPVFGDLQVKQARRVIAIHTHHHIKIINDIISL